MPKYHANNFAFVSEDKDGLHSKAIEAARANKQPHTYCVIDGITAGRWQSEYWWLLPNLDDVWRAGLFTSGEVDDDPVLAAEANLKAQGIAV